MVQQKSWEERYNLPARELFDLLWGDNSSFLENLHHHIGNSQVVVTDWVAAPPPSSSSFVSSAFQRVVFYTLNEGEPTRCSESQRYQTLTPPDTTTPPPPPTYQIQTSVSPEQTHGISFRIETTWKLEESLGVTHLSILLEVECQRAPLWGVGGMVEGKLLGISVKFYDGWVEEAERRVEEYIREKEEEEGGGGVGEVGRRVSSFISRMAPVSLRLRKQAPLRSVMSGTEKLVAMWKGEGEGGGRGGGVGGGGGGVSQAIQEAILGRVERKDSDGERDEGGEEVVVMDGVEGEGGKGVVGGRGRGSPSFSSSPKMGFAAIHHERGGGWGEVYLVGGVIAVCVLMFILFVAPEFGFGNFFQKSYS